MSRLAVCLTCLTLLVAGGGAMAQTRPATSGKLSFHEPELRRGARTGFFYPNAPHRHHRRHRRHVRGYLR